MQKSSKKTRSAPKGGPGFFDGFVLSVIVAGVIVVPFLRGFLGAEGIAVVVLRFVGRVIVGIAVVVLRFVGRVIVGIVVVVLGLVVRGIIIVRVVLVAVAVGIVLVAVAGVAILLLAVHKITS